MVPLVVKRGAEAFGLDPDRLVPLGGNSGSSWGAADRVLRVGQRLDEEIRAVCAAAGVLPVPRVLDRIDLGGFTAALIERLPGQPAGEVATARPELAHAIGSACGALHARLSQVPAPAGLRIVGTCEPLPLPSLLHLDLHPFNVLVDDAATVTGVIDWANAAAGDSVLDRARTWSILMLDPAVLARGSHPGWRALTGAWTRQASLTNLPARARAWACEFMLGDLARRYPAAALKHIDHALASARTQPVG
jgi:aminoglycoside phosphotransferase (APT) family kinase protein